MKNTICNLEKHISEIKNTLITSNSLIFSKAVLFKAIENAKSDEDINPIKRQLTEVENIIAETFFFNPIITTRFASVNTFEYLHIGTKTEWGIETQFVEFDEIGYTKAVFHNLED